MPSEQTIEPPADAAPVERMVSRITLTGVDERTDLDALPDGVEIGVLYTWEPERRHRYPPRSTVVKILERLQGRRLALHVCGGRARAKLLEYALPDLTHLVSRIQVNGQLFPDDVRTVCGLYGGHTIITQHTIQNSELAVLDVPNHVVLVDGSGGRGRSPEQWKRPNTQKAVGFAGGLGPENVRDELTRIQSVAVGEWWIDMEGKLRNQDDWFDVQRANDVVAALCG